MPETPSRPAPIVIRDVDPADPAALACLRAYYALLVAQIAGVTPDMLSLPLPDAAKYRPPEGAFLLAAAGGTALGCVSLRPLDGATAEVKRLWIAPEARGQGLARRLMAEIESRARELGYSALKLDSNAALAPAIALYRATGWADCPSYTGFPADIWMEKTL